MVRAFYPGRGPISRDVVFRVGQQPPDSDIQCVGVWTGEKRHALEGEWYIRGGKCWRAERDMAQDVPIVRIYPVLRTDLVEIAGMPIDRVADRHLEKFRQIHQG